MGVRVQIQRTEGTPNPYAGLLLARQLANAAPNSLHLVYRPDVALPVDLGVCRTASDSLQFYYRGEGTWNLAGGTYVLPREKSEDVEVGVFAGDWGPSNDVTATFTHFMVGELVEGDCTASLDALD